MYALDRLNAFESDATTAISHPVIWAMILEFASILMKKRSVSPEEATIEINSLKKKHEGSAAASSRNESLTQKIVALGIEV
jgi:hypothetical protein